MKDEKYSGGYSKHILSEFSKRSLDKEGCFFQDHIEQGNTVLDVGCGPGSLSLQIAERVGPNGYVHAVDIQSEQFPADHNQNIHFQQASIFDLPFEDNTFDAILAHAVLYHLSVQDLALAELKRVLKPGGLLGIRDAEFGGDVCYPSVDDLDKAWEIIEACFNVAGSDIFYGRKQASSLIKAGFDVISLSASYDVFCHSSGYNPNDYALFWQDYIQRHAFKVGYTEDEIVRAQKAVLNWGNHPDAYYGRTRCEAVARKPL
ncbi:MAG: hypothetical protein NV67_02325 [Gammaproteobacteria bacterium (ex Lamellibrachia satsuma)]|nr:MAG: class I SAM-dependent methyltransferase [Gammaproteobacteria bacterium (ex Lamellibrachia satsuma)]RRS37242.1 MAG: hypothetical protein NV67_02325 [Gammaproteobacteria bacterium (ex Lamellibrachia satsuma)]